ncbi:hypothetical protein ACVOMV_36735 [Mesorhizobium atlanticum]
MQTHGMRASSQVQDYNIALIGKKAQDFAAKTPKPTDQPLPASIGNCGFTHIKTLTTRLGDDPPETASPDAGSAATFTNGGTAVSHEPPSRDWRVPRSAILSSYA